jgi:hypothetical protein
MRRRSGYVGSSSCSVRHSAIAACPISESGVWVALGMPIQAALHLARFARTVTIVVRRDGLEATMSSYLIKEIRFHHRISVRPFTEVVDGGGASGSSC